MQPNASYLDRLIKHYGVTASPYLGGYLLPDGSFLDFSEGSGGRSQDHRNVVWVLPSNWEGPRDSRWDGLVRVCKRTGMYRWMPESWSLEGWTAPTRAQLAVVAMLARQQELGLEAHFGVSHYSIVYDTHESRAAVEHLADFYQGLPVPGWQGSRPNRRWV